MSYRCRLPEAWEVNGGSLKQECSHHVDLMEQDGQQAHQVQGQEDTHVEEGRLAGPLLVGGSCLLNYDLGIGHG